MPELYEKDLFGEEIRPQIASIVARRFGFPPFSVLDSKTGDWQERKRAWLGLGIKSEVGRGDNLLGMSDTMRDPDGSKRAAGEELESGTSIFDPVLCELGYKWFSPLGGQIIDPFSGGSVRGIVAGALGRKYWGCDLRAEQIAANIAQGGTIALPEIPTWVCGDSLKTLPFAPEADSIFSCPPYGDLEVYSEDPSDLSAMAWTDFRLAYRDIIGKAVERLKPNRFAMFVVGDFRDEKGHYRNFVSETISAFISAGANYYNEGILLTSVGSAAMRVSKQFSASRKFAKTHQNVLVFVKGDGKKAAQACGKFEEVL